MNILNFRCISSLCILISIISCSPTATFDEPQPYGINEEYSFDKKILGKFQSTDSTVTLIIEPNLMTINKDSYTDIPKNALDPSYRLSGDSLIYMPDNSWIKVQVTDTSIIQHDIIVDTIFSFAKNNVLKKYKGHYFLNNQDEDSGKWKVSKIDIKKNTLTMASIYGKEDIDLLNEITETPEDTSKTTINYDLNKKQFKKFLKSDGFRNIDTFIRIKN